MEINMESCINAKGQAEFQRHESLYTPRELFLSIKCQNIHGIFQKTSSMIATKESITLEEHQEFIHILPEYDTPFHSN
jgi:hypothetical protein